MEKMKDAVNAAASGEGVPTRRIAGDAGREYILQTTDDVKHADAPEAGKYHDMWQLHMHLVCILLLPLVCHLVHLV